MDIRFATNSGFLQGHFYPVRKSLRGEVLVFDAQASVGTPLEQTPLLEVDVPVASNILQDAAEPQPEVAPEAPARNEPATPSRPTRFKLLQDSAKAFAQLHTHKQLRREKTQRKGFRLANTALSLLIFVSMAAASVLLVPSLYYAVFPADVVAVVPPDSGTAFGGAYESGTTAPEESKPVETAEKKYIPPQDNTLPKGEWLIIPRIGVRSELQPTENPEEALNTGLWLVPDFGRAGDTQLPMIVAAHRFGWEWWWKSDYWKYHSFYNLPETQPGDRIEVISDQRKWVYEIYAGEEGEEITDYEADLILYTCKFLKSPIRHFRYARLIDPTKDTQQ